MTEKKEEQEQREPYALLWVDIETTGLDPDFGSILEIAWWETEFRYPWRAKPARYAPSELSYLQSFVVGLPYGDDEAWNPFALDPAVFDMHARSGLLSEVRRSQHTLENVATRLDDMVRRWPVLSRGAGDLVLLAGSSVSFDQRWLKAKLPSSNLHTYASHRVFDASNLMNMCRSLGMPYPKAPESVHRAKEDLLRSIDLARSCAQWLVDRGFDVPNQDLGVLLPDQEEDAFPLLVEADF